MYIKNNKNKPNNCILFALSAAVLLTACGGSSDSSEHKSGNTADNPDDGFEIIKVGAPRLALGFKHSCFILEDQSVQCWGDNKYGQLGNGTDLTPEDDKDTSKTKLLSRVPVKVKGITGAIALSAGNQHTCALLNTGKVKCWGSNNDGQLGDTSLQDTDSPNAVTVTDLQNVSSISAGNNYNYALLEDGTTKKWGNSYSPTIAEDANIKQIAAGGTHLCTVLNNNKVQCWGNNSNGQLGHSEEGNATAAGIDNALWVSNQHSHSCALLKTGKVKCWGYNLRGQTGNGLGDNKPVKTPATVIGLSKATAISAGEFYSCAVTFSGQVKCWGNNQDGQLGNGTTINKFTANNVSNISSANAVSVSQTHSCALVVNATDEDSVQCWGKNEFGQLGNGSEKNSLTPVEVKF